MINKEQLDIDYKLLDINDTEKITIRYVTLKYKRKARIVHPDKKDGNKEEFQELLAAYRRIIKHLENLQEEGIMESEEDPEKDFFMKHNLMKECSSSIVVYIEDNLVDKWKEVLTRHLTFQNMDKCRVIFKGGLVTITLYAKPKNDPRSKIHIQGGNQKANLDFVMDTMSSFYTEICKTIDNNETISHGIKALQRAMCGKCGKSFTSKKGVKQHILRIHVNKARKLKNNEGDIAEVTLEEATTAEDSVENDTNINYPLIHPHISKNVIMAELSPRLSPVTKKKKVDKDNVEEGEDVIKSLLKDIQEVAIEQSQEEDMAENNNIYQCGECGNSFQTEERSTLEKNTKRRPMKSLTRNVLMKIRTNNWPKQMHR